MKHIKSISKKGAGILFIIAIAAVVSTAGIMNFISHTTMDITATAVFERSDDNITFVTDEDYLIEMDPETIAGGWCNITEWYEQLGPDVDVTNNTYTMNFTVIVTEDSQVIVSDGSEGITVLTQTSTDDGVTWSNIAHADFTTTETPQHFRIYIETDIALTAAEYNIDIMITPEATEL